jgi:TatD DNase family protein
VPAICEAQHYFSVNPAMIRSAKGRQIIEKIPPDRVLTETDGPYVQTNGRPAKPSDVNLVLDHFASIWKISFEEVEKKVWVNFQAVLGPIKKWQTS